MWPGVGRPTIDEAADRELLPGVDRAVARLDPLGLERMREHARAEAVLPGLRLHDVVVVVVRQQQVRDLEPLALGLLHQRPRRAAGVDRHGLAAGLVSDEVGVREPVRVKRAFDDHASKLACSTRRAACSPAGPIRSRIASALAWWS